MSSGESKVGGEAAAGGERGSLEAEELILEEIGECQR